MAPDIPHQCGSQVQKMSCDDVYGQTASASAILNLTALIGSAQPDMLSIAGGVPHMLTWSMTNFSAQRDFRVQQYNLRNVERIFIRRHFNRERVDG